MSAGRNLHIERGNLLEKYNAATTRLTDAKREHGRRGSAVADDKQEAGQLSRALAANRIALKEENNTAHERYVLGKAQAQDHNTLNQG